MPAAALISPVRLADIALGVDGSRRLVLCGVPHLHVSLLSPPPPQTDVLLGGVAGLDLTYFGPSTAAPGQPGWMIRWSDVNPPSLIRVRIRFVAEEQT